MNPDVKIYFPFDMYWGANISWKRGSEHRTNYFALKGLP